MTRNARNNRHYVGLMRKEEDAMISIVLILLIVHYAFKIIKDSLVILSLALTKIAKMVQSTLKQTWSVNNGIPIVQYIILGLDVNIGKLFAIKIFIFSAQEH